MTEEADGLPRAFRSRRELDVRSQTPADPLRHDPFFETIADSDWNACVGVQSDEDNYVDGYIEAARIVARTVIEQSLMGSRDTLVMPILYNARHGLELALKSATDGLARLNLMKRRDGADDHQILDYWRHLDNARVADRNVRKIVASLEHYVQSLARVDGDGQALRYFKGRDGAPSMRDVTIVNLLLVQRSVEELAGLLATLQKRVAVLRDEQGTGTRTTRCSRTDLSDIANILGHHSTWKEEGFVDRKAMVMDRFDLTKKAFSNAVDAIRASRPLAASVGIETGLVYLRDHQAAQLAGRWLQVFPPRHRDAEPRIFRPDRVSAQELGNYATSMSALVAGVEGSMSMEEFADVETIFYIGRSR